jgi:hypothetical protein
MEAVNAHYIIVAKIVGLKKKKVMFMELFSCMKFDVSVAVFLDVTHCRLLHMYQRFWNLLIF